MQAKKKKRSVFAHRLRILRRQTGVTQKEIAQSLNIDRSTYAYYETDKTNPDLITLRRMANIFQVSTDYLLGIEPADGHTVPVRDRGPEAPLLSEGTLSALPEDERVFLLLYRQLEAEQKENLVQFVMEAINRERPSEAENRDPFKPT